MSQQLARVAGASLVKNGRFITTSSVVQRGNVTKEVHPGYIKIREQYKRFQVDDGVPVHFKGGARDKALFGFTTLLLAWGLLECGRYYYVSAFPPKRQ